MKKKQIVDLDLGISRFSNHEMFCEVREVPLKNETIRNAALIGYWRNGMDVNLIAEIFEITVTDVEKIIKEYEETKKAKA